MEQCLSERSDEEEEDDECRYVDDPVKVNYANCDNEIVNFEANTGRALTRRTTLKGPELTDTAKKAMRRGKFQLEAAAATEVQG